jgi:hypothetical protein
MQASTDTEKMFAVSNILSYWCVPRRYKDRVAGGETGDKGKEKLRYPNTPT